MVCKRRQFLKALLLGTVYPGLPGLLKAAAHKPPDSQQIPGYGSLTRDPEGILHLPPGFSYQVLTVTGQAMSDGLGVPGWPDSMGLFPLDRQRIELLCNHELDVAQKGLSGWHGRGGLIARYRHHLYDSFDGQPAPGGVRRVIYNMATRSLEKQHMVLAGTLRNCSGGTTPWGSWISCEETVKKAGSGRLSRDHGYCFEVPAGVDRLVTARPCKAMGRFNHEAAAVDPHSGVVYLTEDRIDGLFYRFIPDIAGNLDKGKLQALALRAGISNTSNHRSRDVTAGEALFVHWVDIGDPESPDDSLRYQGRQKGAAVFSRGEGMWVERTSAGTRIWVMCTIGGSHGLGQIFHYMPSSDEGRREEKNNPGRLSLFVESHNPHLLRNGDNLAGMPNGDLLVCEDHAGKQRLVGITADGEFYVVAENARGASEFAGAVFSPDGSTLFVNLQQQGGTLAIYGPWGNSRHRDARVSRYPAT